VPNSITVSFIIPCYNAASSLERLLNELPRQTYPHGLIEVVVIDDGSTESVFPVFEAFKARFADFSHFSLIRHTVNRGRASARNSGIMASSGEILIFCDVDDYPAPDYIEKTIALHTQFRLVAVRANIRILPEIRRRSAFLRYRDSRYLGARSKAELNRLNADNLPPSYFVTCGISVERASIMAVGLFDETFSSYGGEDEDMGFRLFCSGVRIIFSADSVMWDADCKLTVSGACSKYKRYGADSGDILFAKHPEYCHYSPFGRLEPICMKAELGSTAFKNSLLRLALRPWLARRIVRVLTAIDDNPGGFNPPSILYKYVLSSSYLEGVRGRNTQRPMRHPGVEHDVE